MPKISVGETDVLILCGGFGTRFREVRDDIPKSIEKDWLPAWIHSHRIFGLRTDQTFHDIGTSERYREIQSKL